MKSPPETLWLPAPESQGRCYHAHVCGAHLLIEVPYNQAVDRIREEGLLRCSHCAKDRGLPVIGGCE